MTTLFYFEPQHYASQSHADLAERDAQAAALVLGSYPELSDWSASCAWVAWATYCQSIHESGWLRPRPIHCRDLEFLDFLAMRQSLGPQAIVGDEDRLILARPIWQRPLDSKAFPTRRALTH